MKLLRHNELFSLSALAPPTPVVTCSPAWDTPSRRHLSHKTLWLLPLSFVLVYKLLRSPRTCTRKPIRADAAPELKR
ncbi:hypothetical protein HPB48_020864 [Haemaphysalis longicornis]|uniref:Uncharacterized protein n=1 Tax=Haemaphysalis longicornis TaxID=44386 RepID=A0A9J6GJF2_HAELO|nr:hypothetical protein HPB48_020864 [Haemaphysalis longicornis]